MLVKILLSVVPDNKIGKSSLSESLITSLQVKDNGFLLQNFISK